VQIFGEMCVSELIYSYVAVLMFCAVRCVCLCYWLLFASILITRLMFFNILLCLFSCFVYFVFLCIVLCVVLCIVLYIVSPFVYSCLFPIIKHVYRQLPPGGSPIAVNKYHIVSYHIIYILSYQITSYHITSHHITSYHISYHITSNHITSHHIIYHTTYIT
jgi:hypothetical protein